MGTDDKPVTSDTYNLGTQDPVAAGDFTFNCAASQTQTCRLAQGTTYFLALNGSTTWSEWAQFTGATNSGNETNTPSGAGRSIAYPSKWKSGNNWQDEDHTVMIKVTAETR